MLASKTQSDTHPIVGTEAGMPVRTATTARVVRDFGSLVMRRRSAGRDPWRRLRCPSLLAVG
jgi:hypothetical protein